MLFAGAPGEPPIDYGSAFAFYFCVLFAPLLVALFFVAIGYSLHWWRKKNQDSN